jgi:hypothetical protein
MLRPALARALLLALGLVAALEWLAAARAYRATLGPDDWRRADAALAALPAGEPVFLGTPWLGPGARQQLPRLRDPTALAPPDLRGLPRFHVLGHAGSPGDGAWSSELQEDLGELPPPTLVGRDELGPLVLHHYAQPAAPPHTDWLAAPAALTLRDDRGACRLSSGTWSCRQGRASVALVEVGYRPRRCLAVELDDGATLEVTTTARLGDVLRGHLGFGDFNARLRNDAPALLELSVDDVLAGRWVVTDSQGWAAFAAPTAPGDHAVRVRLTPLLSGTWTDAGYAPQPRRTACLELRALTEAAP